MLRGVCWCWSREALRDSRWLTPRACRLVAASWSGRLSFWQDYCGVLTEESIRKNFILIYELLDEMIVRRGP